MADSTPAIVFAELAARRASLLARSVPDLFAANPARFERFHAVLGDLLYDFSKQRIDTETLRLLLALAEAAGVAAKRDAMFRGELVNSTERRAALHSALRDLSGAPVLVDGVDVAPPVKAERDKMLAFAADVREGRVRGALGQPMTNVVNIGIGGSDLGPAMAARALAPFAQPGLRSHFVSNVDGADIADTLHGLEPARTLFIVSSKTFTTQETMTNAAHRARLDRRRARRRRGRRPFRRGVDAARQGRRIRRRGDAGVRLLGLGRRPLFDLVEHRPAAGDRRRTGSLSRIPAAAAPRSTRISARRRRSATFRC